MALFKFARLRSCVGISDFLCSLLIRFSRRRDDLRRIIFLAGENDLALDMPINDRLVALHDLADCIVLSLSLNHGRNVQLFGSVAASFHEDALHASSWAQASQVVAHAAVLASVQDLRLLVKDCIIEAGWNMMAVS